MLNQVICWFENKIFPIYRNTTWLSNEESIEKHFNERTLFHLTGWPNISIISPKSVSMFVVMLWMHYKLFIPICTDDVMVHLTPLLCKRKKNSSTISTINFKSNNKIY